MKEKEDLPRKITPEQRREIVELIHGEPAEIFLFSGGIAKGKNGRLRATTIGDGDIADGDKFGYLGGVYRMLATVELAKLFPDATIITSAVDLSGISHAKVYAEQLRQHGVKNKILLEEKSVSTRRELSEMMKMAVATDMKGPIAVVVNDYHIERTVESFARIGQLIIPEDPAFANVIDEFTARNIEVLFTPAEDVLDIIDPRYKAFFEKLTNTQPYKDAIELRHEWENRGVEALKSGTYQKRQTQL